MWEIKRKQQTLLEESKKGFKEKAAFGSFSYSDGIPDIRQKEKQTGFKRIQVVFIFRTLILRADNKFLPNVKCSV